MSKLLPYICAIPGRPNQAGISAGKFSQCVPIVPYIDEGEIRPVSDASSDHSAYYKTPFVYETGNNGSLGLPDVVTFFRRPASGSLCSVYHYQPYSWTGAVPEVIAAILLQMGLPRAYIEEADFTSANGKHDSTLGDTPYVYDPPDSPGAAAELFCWRRVGQKVIELVLEVARHARDLVFVNEAGKIDISSFTSPQKSVSGLGLADGIVGSVEWAWTSELIFNKVAATWGQAFRCWGEPADPPNATGFCCQEEPQLDSFQENSVIHEATNAASVARYGELWLPGHERFVSTTGTARKIAIVHFPFFLNPGVTDALWTAGGVGGMQHVVYWLASDSKERRMVTVTQDFRALDWGIGTRVSNVAVTDDGQTINTAWCIERTYDFDRLTVTSVLMEQPANT